MKVVKLNTETNLYFYLADTTVPLKLPFIASGISAGFPSPADDFIEQSLDLNKYLIKHPSSTFCARVRGNSMKNAGMHDGDIMIVDKSLEPKSDDIAVCWIDGEFTVKRILKEKDVIWLLPENEDYKPIRVTAENELTIWGIVIAVIKKFK